MAAGISTCDGPQGSNLPCEAASLERNLFKFQLFSVDANLKGCDFGAVFRGTPPGEVYCIS